MMTIHLYKEMEEIFIHTHLQFNDSNVLQKSMRNSTELQISMKGDEATDKNTFF